MLVESLHEMGVIAVNAMHRERLQHEAYLGGRFDVHDRRQDNLINASIGSPAARACRLHR